MPKRYSETVTKFRFSAFAVLFSMLTCGSAQPLCDNADRAQVEARGIRSAWDSNGTGALRVPDSSQHIVLRSTWPMKFAYGNICYEGNNISMRGPLDNTQAYGVSGPQLATRWRDVVSRLRCVFVLRDSLFSQQDHPYRHQGYAFMLPPNWVTAVVAASLAGNTVTPMSAPGVDDDAGWGRLSLEELYGDLPANQRLFVVATVNPSGAQRLAARHTLQRLADLSRQLINALPEGAECVARLGGELIAASDVAYFGADLRRHTVIPIFVENPTLQEREKGKGLEIAGDEDFDDDAVRLTRREVYRRRLQDGDIALERYNLASTSERRRAVGILESLIPTGSSGHAVWLWVTGNLDPDKILKGEDATAWIEAFRKEIAAAPIESRRLKLLSKPDVDLPVAARAMALQKELDRMKALDLPLSVNLTGPQLEVLFAAMPVGPSD